MSDTPAPTSSNARNDREPRWDLLRVGAVWLLVPYHCARVFDEVPFYASTGEPVRVLTVAARVVEQWHMPLLFLVAGVVATASLRRRSRGAFARERAARLLPPLALGVLTLLPFTGWLAARWRGSSEPLWAYWPTFLTVDLDRLDGFEGTFSPQHLWFLVYLFVIAVVTLPIVAGAASGRIRVTRVAAAVDRRPALVAAVAVPVWVANLAALPYPSPVSFALWYLLGALVGADPRFLAGVVRVRAWATAAAVTLAAGYVAVRVVGAAPHDYLAANPLWQALRALLTSAAVLCLVGWASRLGEPRGRWWRAARATSMPVYLLHHPVVVAVAVLVPFVAAGPWPLAYATLVGISAAATAGLAVLSRRAGPLRPALGLSAPLGRPAPSHLARPMRQWGDENRGR